MGVGAYTSLFSSAVLLYLYVCYCTYAVVFCQSFRLLFVFLFFLLFFFFCSDHTMRFESSGAGAALNIAAQNNRWKR